MTDRYDEIMVPLAHRLGRERIAAIKLGTLNDRVFLEGRMGVGSHTDTLCAISGQRIDLHVGDLDALILGLQKLRAGPLGRIAIELEANPPAASVVAEEPPAENENERMFTNHYRCDRCDHEWQDEWSCACDDDCPECGLRHMTPYKSEDAG